MKKVLLVLTLFALASCTKETPEYIEGGSSMQSLDETAVKLKYFKDSRTGLCFAERGVMDSYTMTCVPCSEEVENLIGR